MADARPNIGPDGVLYPSIRAACRKFNKSEHPVYKRMRRGMTLAQAIQASPDIDGNSVTYNAQKYPSLKALCDACGATYTVVYTRVKKGVPLESALAETKHGIVHDAFGTEYTSARALCKDWDISRDVFAYHLRNGRDTVTAMSLAACAKWPGTYAGPYRIVQCIQWPWFLCQDACGDDIILDAKRIKNARTAIQEDIKEPERMSVCDAALNFVKTFETHASAAAFGQLVSEMARQHDEKLRQQEE